jgi:hypothetical protein
MARAGAPRASVSRLPGREIAGHIEAFLLRFAREPLLWPVLLVLIVHAAAIAGSLLVVAVRDGEGSAWLGLAVGVAASAAFPALELWLRRRLGTLAALTLATWLLAAALGWLANRYSLI